MRIRRFAIAGMLLAVFVGSAMPAPKGDAVTLSVRVQNANGNPLRACITVISPDHKVQSFCQVDHNGVTTIPNLPREKYRVSAKSSGYQLQQQSVDLSAGNGEIAFTLQAK